MHRLLAIACFLVLGCSSEHPQAIPAIDDASRMESVARIAISKSTVPLHRELLEHGVVFVDIEDLEAPCVGLRVPLPNSEKRAFLSFTKEWFHTHKNAEVAAALLDDLDRVLSDLEGDATQSAD